jgi:glutamyl-tRNA synthetase
VFDYDKLLYFNGEYIKRLPDEEFLAKAESFVKSEIPAHIAKEKMLLLLHGRIQKFIEIEDKIGFFLALPEYEGTLFFNKKNKVTEELAKEILNKAIPALAAVDTWNNDTLYAALLALAEEMGVKSGAVLWCLRIAAAGLAVTPGGATEIMEVLGKEETIERIREGIRKLEA